MIRKTHRDRCLAMLACLTLLAVPSTLFAQAAGTSRPRVRDLGLKIGILPPGPLNSITDVAGVTVGHTTIIRGENVRTGVTAVVPHGGNLFQEKVPGAVFVGNGFGKLIGSTQVNELGEIETPILLTSTLSVPKVGDFLLEYMLSRPGNENVQSVNALVAETNDGFLNDIRGRHLTRDDVFNALRNAKSGPVDEGSVGAGTGTVAFGWKGGIGTASRKLSAAHGGHTLGVLVQTNFGGVLSIDGVPVGVELGKYYLKDTAANDRQSGDGSIIIVIATDAPVDHRQLNRLAFRSMSGLARTGSSMTNGSGDYAVAFTTANKIDPRQKTRSIELLGNEAMSPLFQAVIEATEEAIYNSMLRATTVSGKDKRVVEAIPIDRVKEVLRKYRRID